MVYHNLSDYLLRPSRVCGIPQSTASQAFTNGLFAAMRASNLKRLLSAPKRSFMLRGTLWLSPESWWGGRGRRTEEITENTKPGCCGSRVKTGSHQQQQNPFLKVFFIFLPLSLISSTSSLHPRPWFSIPSLALDVAPPTSPSSFLQTFLTNILFPFRRHSENPF